MPKTEMQQATKTLRQFSEKDRDYHAYQARQNYLREQLSRQYEYDEERKARLEAEEREQLALREKQAALNEKQAALFEKQAALSEKQVALSEKQAALQLLSEKDAELERLKALLAQHKPN